MPKEKCVLSIYYPHKSIDFVAVTLLLQTFHRHWKHCIYVPPNKIIIIIIKASSKLPKNSRGKALNIIVATATSMKRIYGAYNPLPPTLQKHWIIALKFRISAKNCRPKWIWGKNKFELFHNEILVVIILTILFSFR